MNDSSAQGDSIVNTPATPKAGWRGSILAETRQHVFELPDDLLEEVSRAVLDVNDPRMGKTSETPDLLSLPSLPPVAAEWLQQLQYGLGIVAIKGLDPQTYSVAQMRAVLWTFASELGQPVRQNARGDWLVDVRDMGVDYSDPETRAYQVKGELGFHSDHTDIVGLLGVKGALSGGRSIVVSAGAVYDRVGERSPALLDVLLQPFYRDRRGEQVGDTLPYFTAPVFEQSGDGIVCMYGRKYIESAQRFTDVPRLRLDQIAALNLFDEVLHEEGIQLRMMISPGDIQFLYNYTVLHDREAYDDASEAHEKRHLVRVWVTVRPKLRRGLPQSLVDRQSGITN